MSGEPENADEPPFPQSAGVVDRDGEEPPREDEAGHRVVEGRKGRRELWLPGEPTADVGIAEDLSQHRAEGLLGLCPVLPVGGAGRQRLLPRRDNPVHGSLREESQLPRRPCELLGRDGPSHQLCVE